MNRYPHKQRVISYLSIFTSKLLVRTFQVHKLSWASDIEHKGNVHLGEGALPRQTRRQVPVAASYKGRVHCVEVVAFVPLDKRVHGGHPGVAVLHHVLGDTCQLRAEVCQLWVGNWLRNVNDITDEMIICTSNHLNILMKCINYLKIFSVNHYAWKLYDLLRLNSSTLLALRLKVQSKKILEVLFCTKKLNIACM